MLKKTKKKKMSTEEMIFHLIAYTILGFVFLICAYPFYYMLIATISNNHEVTMGRVLFWPTGIHFKNYIQVFKVNHLLRSAGVTILRVLVGTIFRLLTTSYMAYFFTKQNMWGRKIWYRMLVVTMYFSAGMIPVYMNLRSLHLLNTFWVYVIPGMLSVYDMVLVKTSIEALPADLEESAYMDGAGYMTRFFRIVLPLSKPILATVGLFSAVAHWNDFFSTKLYVTSSKYYTLQFLLYETLNQIRALMDKETNPGGEFDYNALTPLGLQMTFTAVVTIPIMLVYPFVQKYYVKGIMIGAVKG